MSPNMVAPRSPFAYFRLATWFLLATLCATSANEAEGPYAKFRDDFYPQSTLGTCPDNITSTVQTGTQFDFCALITTVIAGNVVQFVASNVTVGETPSVNTSNAPLYQIVLDADSILFLDGNTNTSSLLRIANNVMFLGSGTLDISSTGSVQSSAVAQIKSPVNMDGPWQITDSQVLFERPLMLNSQLTIAGGAFAVINQPYAWYESVFSASAVVSGSGSLIFRSGKTLIQEASVVVPIAMEGSTANRRTREQSIYLSNATVNPLVQLCATNGLGTNTITVTAGAGLSVDNRCNVTNNPGVAASINNPVVINSGGWMVFENVFRTALPLQITSSLTLNTGHRLHAVVCDPTGDWSAAVLRISTTSCPTFTGTLEGCNTTSGCALLSRITVVAGTSPACEIYVSHGGNFRSGTYQMISLIPCALMDYALFQSQLALYVPSALNHIANFTVSCGSSIMTFVCNGASTALADAFCTEIVNSAALRDALGVTSNTNTGDSNGGLYALFALLVIPMLCICALACMVLTKKLRQVNYAKRSRQPEQYQPLNPVTEHFQPAYPHNEVRYEPPPPVPPHSPELAFPITQPATTLPR